LIHPAKSPPGSASIADDLAARGWSVARGLFEGAVLDGLEAEAGGELADGRLRAAEVGQGADRALRQDVRGDRIRWIDPASATAAERGYLDRMERLRLQLNAELFLGLDSLEAHLSAYLPGTRYRRHLDRFARGGERAISAVLYLNRGWRPEDGGELRLYAEHGEVEVAPEMGTLAVFRSDTMWHEVLPAASLRLGVAAWYRRRVAGMAR